VGLLEFTNYLDVVTGHGHLHTFGESDGGGNVGGSAVHLGSVTVEEGFLTSTFLSLENVDISLELLEGGLGPRGNEELASVDWSLSNIETLQQNTALIAGHPVGQLLVEHFDTSDLALVLLVTQTDDLNVVTNLDLTGLDSSSGNSTFSGNRENRLQGHEERLINSSNGIRDEFIYSLQKVLDGGHSILALVTLKSGKSGTSDERSVIALETVHVQEFTHLHFNEVNQLHIRDSVHLVQEHHQSGKTDLLRQKDMLSGLRHRAVHGRDHKDTSVHLSGTAQHILNEIGVTRTVNVTVVTLPSRILYVSLINSDSSSLLFGSLVNHIVTAELSETIEGLHMSDRCSEGGFTMINVTNGTDVHMWLVSNETREQSGSRW